ncbi:MAG: cupredoxin family copper-binding protein [Gemmatimonadetes bacterium]|nr:cupredoxin family copper-binding protein [Gemmatimonadota bacterium]
MAHRSRTPFFVPLLAVAAAAPITPAAAQDVLDRTPNMMDVWVGVPWELHVLLPHRFHDVNPGEDLDLGSTTTFTFALGFPWSSMAGVAYAMRSPTAPGEPDEVEAFVRYRPISDLAVTGAWNSAAGSFDAEAAVARRLGSVHVHGGARWFSDARGAGDDDFALAAGATWHPLPRSAPIALSGDIAVPLDRAEGEDPAWSAGVQVGIPHTAVTLSLQASNTAATTLQGTTFGQGRTRYGFEATVPIPVGFFLGGFPDREAAAATVREEPGESADVVVDVERYAFGRGRIEVPAGSVVEWVNRDAVVHTATALDNAWNSGAIPPGQSWKARFDRPGIYPYYCGPHPFMRGVVIVR